VNRRPTNVCVCVWPGGVVVRQGSRQVKICGVDRVTDTADRHGESVARAYNGGLEAEPTGPTPPTPPLYKLVGFVSISGATSGKSGVDMSTPVHPVATPLWLARWTCDSEGRGFDPRPRAFR